MNDIPRPRIFISSLMQGYGHIRDAAAQGIERAGCQPVRAEDFPAVSLSPRTACLDGVASCDGLVLILGARYGVPTAVGISATAEEYREAVQRKIPIHPFLEDIDTEREPQQAEFVRGVEHYVGGHWRKTFRTTEELTNLVEQALHQATPLAADGVEMTGVQRLDDALGNRPPKVQSVVWVQTLWTTLRDEPVLDPTEFNRPEFQRQVQRLAHEGEPPLFAYEQGKQTDAQITRLHVSQGAAGRWQDGLDLVALDLYANGTVSVALNVTGMQARDHTHLDLGAMYRIEPDQVVRRLEQAWGFAARWWEHHDLYRRHDTLLTQVALYDIEMHRLEQNPGHPVTSITGLGISSYPPNPLLVYDNPRRIVRADLLAPVGEIQRALHMLQLRFDGAEWR